MAIREIIEIDEEKCDGCGLCIPSCVEGALALVDGKVRLVKDSYCDGMGACLGECPRGALRIVHREADEFSMPDHVAPAAHAETVSAAAPACASASAPVASLTAAFSGCPGSAARSFAAPAAAKAAVAAPRTESGGSTESALRHWPVQLCLVPPHASFLAGTDMLLAADCVPFAYADFHRDLLAGRSLLVGCPKLDDLDLYARKLAAIFETARPRSLTIARMEVPCCGGIVQAALHAKRASGWGGEVRVVTVSVEGERLETEGISF